jgi:hypothetical protein
VSLGGLHSFFPEISTPPFIALITVATALLLWLMQFHGSVPGVVRIDRLLRIGLPDMMLTYSPGSIYERRRVRRDGRCAYGLFLKRVDFLLPAFYGLFFISVNSWLFPAVSRSARTPEAQFASVRCHFL